MRILFLSSWFPYPPTNGAKIRIYNLIRQLAEDHEITLLAFARWSSVEEAQQHIPHLTQFCTSVEVVASQPFVGKSLDAIKGYFSSKPRYVVQAFSIEMDQLIQKYLESYKFDVVIASEVGAPGPTSLLATKIKMVPIILDAIEVALTKDAYQRETSIFRRIRKGLTWMKLKRFTRDTILKTNACTVPSFTEKQNIIDIIPDFSPIKVIPHSLDLRLFTGSFRLPKPDSLIFTGSFDYYTNRDAAYYFLEEIYPHLKVDHPDACLQIVGNTDGTDLSDWKIDDSITFAGFMDDVRPSVAESWLSVVPLRDGAGTRLKIIESMALGTPVVSTSKGAEGLDVTHGENILIADDPGAFAKNISDILRNQDLHHRLSIAGRELVKARYSTEAMGKKFNNLLDHVVRIESCSRK